jgi:uncharacterized protein YaeQ
MALKATIFKANLQIADIDRGVYRDHATTLARHPSETDEHLMLRLLALALHLPADPAAGDLEFAKGLWDPDEPELWRRDLTGQILEWIEIGQPDERRLLKAAGRAARVSVYAFSPSSAIWWRGVAGRIARARNVAVWQIAAEQSQALAQLAQRTMQLQCNVQDGLVWIGDGEHSVEISPLRLNPG